MAINRPQLHEARTTTLADGSRYRFAWTKPSVAIDLTELCESSQSDLDYVASFLSLQLVDPRLSVDELKGWPGDRLIELTNGYLNLAGSRVSRGEAGPFLAFHLEDCRLLLGSLIKLDFKRMQESFKQLRNSISKTSWQFGMLNTSIQLSPTWNYLNDFSSLDTFTKLRRSFLPNPNEVAFGMTEGLKDSSKSALDILAQTHMNLGLSLQNVITQQASIANTLSNLVTNLNTISYPSMISGLSTAWYSILQDQLHQSYLDRRSLLLIDFGLEFLDDLTENAIEDAIDEALSTTRELA